MKYQDFTLITIRIHVALHMYELSLLPLLMKTLPPPLRLRVCHVSGMHASLPALGQVLSRAWDSRAKKRPLRHRTAYVTNVIPEMRPETRKAMGRVLFWG